AEVPADHRERGGTAVHRVELVHVGKAANPFRSRDVSVRGRQLFRRLLDLAVRYIRRNLLLNGSVRRQNLVRKVERDTRKSAVFVLPQPLLEPCGEWRVVGDETLEELPRKLEEHAVRHGLQGCRT